MSDDASAKDPLFKGCTRPAMLLGVPIGPMVLVNAVLFFLGMLFNPLLMVLNIVAIVLMRAVVKEDDQMFRLLSLRLTCRRLSNRNAHFWKCAAVGPLKFIRRK